MGQGYSMTGLSAGAAGIDVPELADLTYEKSLGMARFMKSIRARHPDGLVVVKVVMKPYANVKLEPYIRALLRERQALADVPNTLGYERILETSANGYLVRQYLYSSLYDRLSTRPFLEEVEKTWLAFQLLCGLRDCHARDVCHGDIKSENILVTSWNWLYLSDFSAAFKPAFLPEDNPADFSYYFDTSGRRTCYLAPERFIGPKEEANSLAGKVNWAMDIFSAGCLIAELFLETPIFSLSQLYKYRKGEYDPNEVHLKRIENTEIRELVSHMIQREPEARYSADEYLNFWRRKAFPEYFYSFLHQYMALITDPSSGRRPITTESSNLGEADERIDRVYYDFDKVAYFLGYYNETTAQEKRPSDVLCGNNVIPVHIDIPNHQHRASADMPRPADDGTLIFLSVVVSSLRSSARAVSRVRACDLLLAFAEMVTDEAKIDRILPYLVTLVNDRADIVKAAAVRSITQLMALVRVVSPANAFIFPEYILPRLQSMLASSAPAPKPLVRTTYASCIATLANTAARYLDMTQALRADGSLPSVDPETEDGTGAESAYQLLFDVARADLVDYFEAQTKALLTDSDSSVRTAFLGSVSSLCIFFGSAKASEVILSHLNTYLNDKDWQLKCAFFETVVGVGTFLGTVGLEEFVLPLMVQALTDPEDFVVEKVLRSFASLAELGAFQRSKIWELVDIVGRFTMHPNLWIREAAASFLSSATSFVSLADCYCIIAPLIKPYLKYMPADFTELKLLDALKRPLPRPVYDMALSWANNVNKGTFWKPAKHQRSQSFGVADASLNVISARQLATDTLAKAAKTDEDEQWLARLRSLGMTPDDEFKLLALREYIWRVARSRPKDGAGNQGAHLNNVINLKSLGITPQTIFFNDDPKAPEKALQNDDRAGNGKAPRTIAEALAEASTTMNRSPTGEERLGSAGGAGGGLGVASAPAVGRQADAQRSRSKSPSRAGRNPAAHRTAESASTGGQPGGEALARLRPETEATSSDEGGPAPESRSETPDHRTPRRKASAVALMNRAENSKADAATGTTSANAFGTLKAPQLREVSPTRASVCKEKDDEAAGARYRAMHSYDGSDPSVLKLLDALYQEQYPSDVAEFGPLVTPLPRRQQRIKRNTGESTDLPWRPEGGLVALFGEHTAAINRIVIAPDHAFLVSGSDDGTIRVWDTARLERNIAYRSRQTYKHAAGAKIKSICFIENTHCVVSGATDGSVNIIRVDYSQGVGASRYGRLRLLKTYQLQKDEYAMWLEHFKLETYSVLLVATNMSRVVALDLRTMRVMYTLANPVQHGAPTCFCIDRKRAWLLLGTTHGILSLWDLRFRVRVKAWGLPGGMPIHRLSVYPFKGRGRWVCVAGGCIQGEVTVWDIEKSQCREVYRVGGGVGGGGGGGVGGAAGHKDRVKAPEKQYEAWKVDDEKQEGVLSRFATSLEPNGPGGVDRGIRTFVTGMDTLEGVRESRYGFLLTAGSDRKIRFWDMTRIESSSVVSGLDFEEPQPTYTLSQPTQTLIVHVERSPQSAAAAAATTGGPSNRPSSAAGKQSPQPSEAHVSSSAKASVRPPRSTVISIQQQQLLSAHLDSITDVALLEAPYGMIVSGNRSGVIYVFR